MMGEKKLGAIRKQLKQALSSTGEDPIRWLENHTAQSESRPNSSPGEGQVLESLKRLLTKGHRAAGSTK